MFISHEKRNYRIHSQMLRLYCVTGSMIKSYASLCDAKSSLWVFSSDYYVETNMKQQSIMYCKTGLRDFRGLIFVWKQICFPTQNDESNINHALKFKAERMKTLTEAGVLCM
jgi:hypothetical protein